MAYKIEGTSKYKHAVYLRKNAFEIVSVLGDGEGGKQGSISGVLARIVEEHKRISDRSPGALEQARAYLAKQPVDNSRDSTKVQVYLSKEESDYLEKYSQQRTGGNVSVGINRLVGEIGSIAIVCPSAIQY